MSQLDAAHEEYFRKLGVSSILSLSLIAPKGYEDHTRRNTPPVDSSGAFSATLQNMRQVSTRLSVSFWVQDFEAGVEAVFFNAKPYQRAMFSGKADFILYGKLEEYGGKWQCSHPKLLTKFGDIEPVYKTVLRSDTFRRLVSKLVTVESLQEQGLPLLYAQAIFDMHFPKPQDLTDFHEEYKLPKRFVEALKFAEIFSHLKALSLKRIDLPAKPVLCSDPAFFFDSLPFKPTDDQLKAAKEIACDLSKNIQARRVVVGDVGCGKTVVILAAAAMVYPQKSVLMAPTGILASQLLSEARRLLPEHIKIAFLTADSKSDDETVESAHLIIGTHALLYRKLPPCSLVMIDEQHRFGTNQRKELSKLTQEGEFRPHLLQFSATPIPRTLALIESTLVDITEIRQIPFERKVLTTVITKESFGGLLKHIENELRHDRQIAIVYPLVTESESIPYMSLDEGRQFWEKKFDGVFVTHGKDAEKEAVMKQFASDGRILLATTVIEVGVSLPKLSTIVIVGAERLGLSTLHQLRGRVSRNGLEGYCYLYTNNAVNKRLESFCAVTDGFEIAELDLQNRQSGDLIDGFTQSGKSFCFFEPARDEAFAAEARELVGEGFVRVD